MGQWRHGPGTGTGGGATYAAKVLGTASANLIGYWPLWEASGTVADNYEGTAARDGTYSGVTLGQTGIGDGQTCPSFDGTNDYCNIYSTSLNTAFTAVAGTAAIWAIVSGAGVWTDATRDYALGIGVDGDNQVYIRKDNATDNRLRFGHHSLPDADFIAATNSSINWIHLAVTWSETTNEFIAFVDGSQVGTTQSITGTWAGALATTKVNIGCETNSPFANGWNGRLAHMAVWTSVLTPTQILSLATV